MFIVEEDVETYAHNVSADEPELLKQLARETRDTLDMPQMLTGRLEIYTVILLFVPRFWKK